MKGDNNAKRRRLLPLAGLHHVNDSQLAGILKAVAEIADDEDLVVSRCSIGRHLKKQSAAFRSTIDLPCKSPGPRVFPWVVCSLDRLLNHFIRNSSFFKAAVESLVQSHGHEFTLVLYADELTPGDVFAPDNQRKSWCFYVCLRLGVWRCAIESRRNVASSCHTQKLCR